MTGQTELCARCGQAPMFPGAETRGVTYCAPCKAENKRAEIARLKRIDAVKKARRWGLPVGAR